MSGWLGQVPGLLAVIALLVIPGMPAALFLRGVALAVRLAAAVALSLGIIAAAALAAPFLRVEWGLLPVGIVSALTWLIAGGLRFLGRGPRAFHPRCALAVWTLVSVIVSIVGWMIIVAYGIGRPDAPTQLYDGLFHLNAVEFILMHGDASPLHMTLAVPNEETSFYPTLWHALVALVVPIAGSVVAATNVTTVAAIAVVWPTAVAALTSVVFVHRPRATVWAAPTTFGFAFFPLAFLNWGVLYPNLLGTMLIPAFLALALTAAAPSGHWSSRTLRVFVALAAAGAIALGHPSALLAAVALLTPWMLWQAWRIARSGNRTRRVIVGAAVLVSATVLAVIWVRANVTTNEWLPTQTLAQSLGEVMLLSPVWRAAGLLLGPLVAIGVWKAARDRRWWVLGSYAVSVLLFLIAAWFPILSIRSFFVGVWYDDTSRVAALLAVWALPLAALGASAVADWISEHWQRDHRARVTAVIVLIAIAAATHLLPVRNELRYMRNVSFAFNAASQGLSPDEAALFEKMDSDLDEDSVVIGDPLTGAGLLYAYTGREVVFPHVTGRYGADASLLARYLAAGGPDVCAAADRVGVTHALDFGDTVLFENHYTTYDGLHDLDASPILVEVDRVGDAVLYEVTGCE